MAAKGPIADAPRDSLNSAETSDEPASSTNARPVLHGRLRQPFVRARTRSHHEARRLLRTVRAAHAKYTPLRPRIARLLAHGQRVSADVDKPVAGRHQLLLAIGPIFPTYVTGLVVDYWRTQTGFQCHANDLAIEALSVNL